MVAKGGIRGRFRLPNNEKEMTNGESASGKPNPSKKAGKSPRRPPRANTKSPGRSRSLFRDLARMRPRSTSPSGKGKEKVKVKSRSTSPSRKRRDNSKVRQRSTSPSQKPRRKKHATKKTSTAPPKARRSRTLDAIPQAVAFERRSTAPAKSMNDNDNDTAVDKYSIYGEQSMYYEDGAEEFDWDGEGASISNPPTVLAQQKENDAKSDSEEQTTTQSQQDVGQGNQQEDDRSPSPKPPTTTAQTPTEALSEPQPGQDEPSNSETCPSGTHEERDPPPKTTVQAKKKRQHHSPTPERLPKQKGGMGFRVPLPRLKKVKAPQGDRVPPAPGTKSNGKKVERATSPRRRARSRERPSVSAASPQHKLVMARGGRSPSPKKKVAMKRDHSRSRPKRPATKEHKPSCANSDTQKGVESPPKVENGIAEPGEVEVVLTKQTPRKEGSPETSTPQKGQKAMKQTLTKKAKSVTAGGPVRRSQKNSNLYRQCLVAVESNSIITMLSDATESVIVSPRNRKNVAPLGMPSIGESCSGGSSTWVTEYDDFRKSAGTKDAADRKPLPQLPLPDLGLNWGECKAGQPVYMCSRTFTEDQESVGSEVPDELWMSQFNLRGIFSNMCRTTLSQGSESDDDNDLEDERDLAPEEKPSF